MSDDDDCDFLCDPVSGPAFWCFVLLVAALTTGFIFTFSMEADLETASGWNSSPQECELIGYELQDCEFDCAADPDTVIMCPSSIPIYHAIIFDECGNQTLKMELETDNRFECDYPIIYNDYQIGWNYTYDCYIKNCEYGKFTFIEQSGIKEEAIRNRNIAIGSFVAAGVFCVICSVFCVKLWNS